MLGSARAPASSETHEGAIASGRLRERFGQQLSLLTQRLRSDWALSLSLVLALLGIYLRTRRMFISSIPFWGDEATWAAELLRSDLSAPSIRPVGFVALSQFMAYVFGPSEQALRFVPWLAGILTCALVVPLSRQLFSGAASRLLLVGIVALHPYAIDFSKEFKPYSLSLFIHLFCVYGAVCYAKFGSVRWLWATMAAGLVGVLFAQDVIFVYPALYLVLGFFAYRSGRRSHLLALGLGVTFTLSLLLFLYFAYWREMSQGAALRRGRPAGLVPVWWSRGYDVFYTASADESRSAWYLRKYSHLAAFPGVRRDAWEPSWLSPGGLAALSSIDAAIWSVLHVLGLAALAWRRRFHHLALFTLPLVALFAFNLLGRWPYGVYRTNLFTLAYLAPLACAAFDAGVAQVGARLRQLVPVGVLCLAPLAVFETNFHEYKLVSGNSEFVSIMKTLLAKQPGTAAREVVIFDVQLCYVWKYYNLLNPHHRRLVTAVRQRFAPHCVTRFGQTALGYARRKGVSGRFWVAVARKKDVTELSDSHQPFVVLDRVDIPAGQVVAQLETPEAEPAATPRRRHRSRRSGPPPAAPAE